MLSKPTPAEVQAAREAAALTQTEAAALVGLTSKYRWSEIERGITPMHPAAWELFCIKIGAHPDYVPSKAAKTA
jgi:DNA-binding XRE family transcriptional regulator